MHIRKNDIVQVVGGRDKGKKGKVLKVIPASGRAIVEGVNYVKKHARRTREDQQGGILKRESSINASNLMLFCQQCNRPSRVAKVEMADGKRARVCRRCKEPASK